MGRLLAWARHQRVLALAAAAVLVGAGAALAFRRDEPVSRVAALRTPAPTPVATPAPTTSPVPPTPTPAAPAIPRPPSSPRPTRAPRPPATRRPAPPPPAANPNSITAAFYYSWYPGSWTVPGTRYKASAGRYDAEDPAVVKRHIEALRQAGMQAGINSWFGPDTGTDRAFQVGLREAAGTPFKWSIYYELEGPGYPNQSTDQLRESLRYLFDKYARDPSYLRVDDRPVIFVWPDPGDGCDMVRRWKQANTLGFYVVQKVFPPGSSACLADSDSWHQYAPAHATIEAKPSFSFSVSAGFWRYDESSPRLARDPARYESSVRAMAASPAQWKLVTTFNEWGEGTAVESADEWASPSGYGVYVDILNRVLGSR